VNDRWRDRVYVRDSKIEGMGVFARRNFATGETVLRRGRARLVTAKRPLNATKGELERHCDWLWDGRQVYLPYPDRYVNHSCDPNAFLRWHGREAEYVALRPIRVHEEITHHYSLDSSGEVVWRCNCGSERCLRDVPADFFALPLDSQIELLPLLNDWFIREHRDEYTALRERAGLSAEDD
jgi:hypothetical protein